MAAQFNYANYGAGYAFVKAAATKPTRLRRLVSRLTVVPPQLKPQCTRRVVGHSPFPASLLRFNRTRSSTRVHRVVRQQRLRGAVLTPSAVSETSHLRANGPNAGALAAISYAESKANVAQLLRTTPRLLVAKTPVRATFLSRAIPTRRACPRRDQQQAYRHLDTLQRNYRERRFYLKRPRLRLPQTTVTRQRRRRGGLGVFARHSLKAPRTRAGAVGQLLPPLAAYSHLHAVTDVGINPSSTDFIESNRHDDLKPRI